MVLAFGADTAFSAIDLKRPAFDLGDRGVSGRPAPGPLDAWLYADRGIYRPGETVHVVALLRDRAANAADIAQAQLVISRPNGVDYRRLGVGQSGAGAFTADV
ncbi:MG2 domain-containing protein, partial [Klebsiella pneumoniae]